jgi:hypothetical protein
MKMNLMPHNFKTFSPIANTKNLLYYYRKLPDNRILFGTRGDLTGSDQVKFSYVRKDGKVFKRYFSLNGLMLQLIITGED